MCRLTDRIVRSTLVTACRLATSPTSTSPFLAKATTDGVVRAPSVLVMTGGSPPSRTETTEFVVPRSIPTGRAMGLSLLVVPVRPSSSFVVSSGGSQGPFHPDRARAHQGHACRDAPGAGRHDGRDTA